jgi:two-component system, NarL family, response regulator LiaR
MEKITVAIADNQPAFREGLCRLLMDNKDIDVIGQAGDGEEIVRISEKLKPDIVIIDTILHKINGTEATRQIREKSPNTAIIVLSDSNSQNFILSCLRAGAAGYLFKDTPIKDLVAAIRLTHAGEGIIERSAANDIIRRFKEEKAGKSGVLNLHPREVEVLKLAAKGLRNKEMAKELNISERTVQAHLSNIFNKLDVGSRTEAVLQGLKEGLLDMNDLS